MPGLNFFYNWRERVFVQIVTDAGIKSLQQIYITINAISYTYVGCQMKLQSESVGYK